MKTSLILLLALILSPALASAGFNLPRGVFRLEQLSEALKEAKAEGKALTYVYSDEKSTCPLCSNASMAVMSSMKSKSVLVYAHANDDFANLPENVQQSLASPEAGKFIPISVVVEPVEDKVLAIIPYSRDGSDMKKSIRDARKAIDDSGAKATGPDPANDRLAQLQQQVAMNAGLPPDRLRERRTWTALSGSTVEASLYEQKDGSVFLLKPDGKTIRISLNSLSESDRAYLSALKGGE